MQQLFQYLLVEGPGSVTPRKEVQSSAFSLLMDVFVHFEQGIN